MSNNIYDILKKFNNLDSVKNMLSEGKKVCKDCGKAKCECVTESKGSKPDYIDLDKDGDTDEPMKKAAKDKSKGAIAEAVARVEQQLAEKYMGFKKTVDAIKKSGSADNPEAVAAAIGRAKYGKKKFQAAAAAGKKMGEGVKAMGSITPTDSGDEYQAAPGYRVKAEFEPGSTSKPKMGFVKDNSAEPAQTGQGAKPAQPNTGIAPSKEVNEGEYNEDMLSPGQKKIARMSPPPNKIDANDLAALRAGKKKKSEGNAFSGAVAKAKATGQDEFEVGGKEYKVQEGFPTVADAKKRMDAKSGKTAHGTKTVTKTGVKHERDYDADEPTGERGRPKKDKFAK